MARLRGAETVIVGIQPDIAFAMVQLGMQLDDVHVAQDLEVGLAYPGSWRDGGRRATRATFEMTHRAFTRGVGAAAEPLDSPAFERPPGTRPSARLSRSPE